MYSLHMNHHETQIKELTGESLPTRPRSHLIPWTPVIVIVACILVITAILFFFLYRQKLVPCEHSNETQCQRNPKCRAITGPSGCNGKYCTTDEQYYGCETISASMLEQAKRDKLTCKRTGGTWNTVSYAKPGKCECDFSTFQETVGCPISIQLDCEKTDGQLINAGTQCNTQLAEIDPFNCPTTAVHTSTKICICSDGKVWTYKDRCDSSI